MPPSRPFHPAVVALICAPAPSWIYVVTDLRPIRHLLRRCGDPPPPAPAPSRSPPAQSRRSASSYTCAVAEPSCASSWSLSSQSRISYVTDLLLYPTHVSSAPARLLPSVHHPCLELRPHRPPLPAFCRRTPVRRCAVRLCICAECSLGQICCFTVTSHSLVQDCSWRIQCSSAAPARVFGTIMPVCFRSVILQCFIALQYVGQRYCCQYCA